PGQELTPVGRWSSPGCAQLFTSSIPSPPAELLPNSKCARVEFGKLDADSMQVREGSGGAVRRIRTARGAQGEAEGEPAAAVGGRVEEDVPAVLSDDLAGQVEAEARPA